MHILSMHLHPNRSATKQDIQFTT